MVKTGEKTDEKNSYAAIPTAEPIPEDDVVSRSWIWFEMTLFIVCWNSTNINIYVFQAASESCCTIWHDGGLQIQSDLRWSPIPRNCGKLRYHFLLFLLNLEDSNSDIFLCICFFRFSQQVAVQLDKF